MADMNNRYTKNPMNILSARIHGESEFSIPTMSVQSLAQKDNSTHNNYYK